MSTRLNARKSKLLCLWDGRPIIRHALDNISASPVSKIIVVVGHQGESVMRALDGRKVDFIKNGNPAGGMSGSLIAGLQKANEGERPDGVMVCLGDMPLIQSSTISALVQRFSESPKPCIWRPACKGRAGHPVIFSTGLLDDLTGLQGDRGAKKVIEANGHLVNDLAVEDAGVLFDVDTRHSLDQLRENGKGVKNLSHD
ncbi:MAG: nucleotidyltransferase family protein [Oleiphilaceae bacterium]|nr:nucleotidyltransferase family protein [Oleiphilaceae bacterium]